MWSIQADIQKVCETINKLLDVSIQGSMDETILKQINPRI